MTDSAVLSAARSQLKVVTCLPMGAAPDMPVFDANHLLKVPG